VSKYHSLIFDHNIFYMSINFLKIISNQKLFKNFLKTFLQKLILKIFLQKTFSTKKKCKLNERQKINRDKLYSAQGNPFTQEQINSVKEVAYAGRNLTKSLWESLDITVQSLPVSRIKTKII